MYVYVCIKRIQKRALKIILPGMSYEHTLRQSNLKNVSGT